jgi:hypothetical protein
MVEWKLTSEFLKKCTVLEKTFKELISPIDNTVKLQFEDFIMQHWNVVKHMNESQFVNFVVNEKMNGPFQDLVKYILNDLIFTDIRICQILAVLPASSTDPERGFSRLSLIKKDNRASLAGEHLESALRISVTDMDEIEIEKHSSILTQRWRNAKRRRSVGNNPH